VTIRGSPTFGAGTGLYGWHTSSEWCARSASGYENFGNNTLNLHSADLSVKDLQNFQSLNFYLPETLAAGGTMIAVNGIVDPPYYFEGGVVDLAGVMVNVGLEGAGPTIRSGSRFVLIAAREMLGDFQPMTGTLGGHSYTVAQESNSLVLVIDGVRRDIQIPGSVIAPAPRVDATIQIPGFGNDDYSRLSDNRGRAWVRPLPLDADIVFRLPQPLSRLLFQWMSSGNYNHNMIQYGAPTGYRIEVSSNSTNGSDGNWEEVADVSDNRWAARAHLITGERIQWIRFRVTGGGSSIDEFDIHDLSLCQPGIPCDTWGFLGDSITADTFWRGARAGEPFNEMVSATCNQFPRFPSMINFGVGGNNSRHLLAELQQPIDDNTGVHFWAIGIGTNDGEVGAYEQNLRSILNMLRDNGKQPILAYVPYSSVLPDSHIRSLNEVIERLGGEYGLAAGPDLYTHFRSNPSHLRDGIHPTDGFSTRAFDGVAAIQRLWAKAACVPFGFYTL
jgi:hypothetical protein